MGTVRLMLSLLVVGSHFGGLNGIAGGTAVASFFAMSGFIMARAITENYSHDRGAVRFYLNRCVRIVPPAVIVLLATALLLWARESRPFQLTPQGGLFLPDTEFPPSLAGMIQLNPRGFPNYLFPQVYLAPQMWSLVVEGFFYAIVPLLMVLAVQRRAWVLSLAALASFSFAVISVASPDGNMWMRSPFSTLWIFLLGSLAYLYSHAAPIGATPHRYARRLALVPLLMLAMLGLHATDIPDWGALFLAPVLVVIWLTLGQWSVRRGGRLDRALGNVAYGVFVGHFLSSLLMLSISEGIYRLTGIFGIFGVPDVSGTRFRVSFYVCAIVLGAGIYYGIERPLERARAAIRRSWTPADSVLSVQQAGLG